MRIVQMLKTCRRLKAEDRRGAASGWRAPIRRTSRFQKGTIPSLSTDRSEKGTVPFRPLPTLLGVITALFLSLTTSTSAQEVDIELDSFGVGAHYRHGEIVAIRLKLTALPDSTLDEATGAWVQIEIPNADGDIVQYGRPLALTRGFSAPVWLYAPLSPETPSTAVYPVRVYIYEDGRRGREIGGERISPSVTGRVDIHAGMIGVIGNNPLALQQLLLPNLGPGGNNRPAHEDTRIVFGIRPPDLCDKWEGLAQFSAIAWGGDALPQDLPLAQAEALQEWIRRGGHLIIVLPEDTNPWGLGETGRTELDHLLPPQAPRKDDEVPLIDLLPVLSKAKGLGSSVDISMGVRVFKDVNGDFDAIERPWEPLMALPDGRVVTISRTFGQGFITLVGIDISAGRLSSLPLSNNFLSPLPQADVFWNRILGRRGDTPTRAEMSEILKQDRLNNSAARTHVIGDGRVILPEINLARTATAGLLMAFVLFFGYWLVAGPIGYAILKQYRRVEHSWMAFAAAAGIFTALAWAGVTVARGRDINVMHLTFLDVIARPAGAPDRPEDPQLHRAVSYLSLYLPGYADTPVGIESEPMEGPVPAQRDLLYSWMPPGVQIQSFPDVDRYTINVGESPDDYLIPARSTSTHLYANWMGPLLDPEWSGLLASDPSDPIRVELNPAGNEVLKGRIINQLPSPIEDLTIIWVQSAPLSGRRYDETSGREAAWVPALNQGSMLNQGHSWRTGLLGPRQKINLGGLEVVPGRTRLEKTLDELYVRKLREANWMPSTTGPLTTDERRQYMEAISFFQQLTPPAYLKARPEDVDEQTVVLQRMLGRELDLSTWFSRPCVIVLGYLRQSPCPVPLRVRDEPVTSEGLTVLRWIHPLPVIESVAFPDVRPPDAEEDAVDGEQG